MAFLHSTAVLHFICSTRLPAGRTPSVGSRNNTPKIGLWCYDAHDLWSMYSGLKGFERTATQSFGQVMRKKEKHFVTRFYKSGWSGSGDPEALADKWDQFGVSVPKLRWNGWPAGGGITATASRSGKPSTTSGMVTKILVVQACHLDIFKNTQEQKITNSNSRIFSKLLEE